MTVEKLRRLAEIALGDFWAGLPIEEKAKSLKSKMLDIAEDNNFSGQWILNHLEMDPIKFLKETEVKQPMKTTKDKASSEAKTKKEAKEKVLKKKELSKAAKEEKASPVAEKPKTTKEKEEKTKNESKAKKPVAPPAPVEPPKATPVTTMGRPRKHNNGGQVSVWLADETRRAVRIKAAENDVTMSDLIARIIIENLQNY